MTTPREDDEFRRIELMSHLERECGIVALYEQNLAFYRTRIEERLYELGKLDQRLGGESDGGV
jgi:hypothetical protein